MICRAGSVYRICVAQIQPRKHVHHDCSISSSSTVAPVVFLSLSWMRFQPQSKSLSLRVLVHFMYPLTKHAFHICWDSIPLYNSQIPFVSCCTCAPLVTEHNHRAGTFDESNSVASRQNLCHVWLRPMFVAFSWIAAKGRTRAVFGNCNYTKTGDI